MTSEELASCLDAARHTAKRVRAAVAARWPSYIEELAEVYLALVEPEWVDRPDSVGWWQVIQQNGDTEIVEVLAGRSKLGGAPALYFQATGSDEDYFLDRKWAPKLWRKVELAPAPQKESGQ